MSTSMTAPAPALFTTIANVNTINSNARGQRSNAPRTQNAGRQMPVIRQWASGPSGTEAETEPVQRAQPQVAGAVAAVGTREGPDGELDSRRPDRFRRKRDGLVGHHCQLGELGRLSRQQVENHSGPEPDHPDAEARLPGRIGQPAAMRSAEEGAEPRAGVDAAAQVWVNDSPASCGKVSKKCSASRTEVRGR